MTRRIFSKMKQHKELSRANLVLKWEALVDRDQETLTPWQRMETHAVRDLGFIFSGYHCRCWYYELVEMLRKLVLTGLIMFVPGSTAQVAAALFVSTVSLLNWLNMKPMLDPRSDRFNQLSLSCLACTLYAGLLLRTNSVDGSTRESVVFNLLLLLLVLAVIVMPVMLLGIHVGNVLSKLGVSASVSNRLRSATLVMKYYERRYSTSGVFESRLGRAQTMTAPETRLEEEQEEAQLLERAQRVERMMRRQSALAVPSEGALQPEVELTAPSGGGEEPGECEGAHAGRVGSAAGEATPVGEGGEGSAGDTAEQARLEGLLEAAGLPDAEAPAAEGVTYEANPLLEAAGGRAEVEASGGDGG
mmetsp:Transcript_14088/g.48537  ORF Transcript_14088/g.48537 Transcript_14088/m.48537 type:complete len:360 (+) Transcript_14088:1544-2623(+)